jgi:ABC-type transporter MlaC component
VNLDLKAVILAGAAAMAIAIPASAEADAKVVLTDEPPGSEAGAADDRAVDLVSVVGAEALRALQQPSPARQAAMAQIIERYVDLGFVLRSSLPPDLLAALDDGERVAVVKAYQSFAAADYARVFEAYGGEQIDILSVTMMSSDVARVETRLRSSQIEGGDVMLSLIVAGLETGRPGLRDLIVDGASTLATQQALIADLWAAVGQDKKAFLQQISAADPWAGE